MTGVPTLNDIQAAAERIRPYAHRTPVLESSSIDAIVEARLHFKCENFQKVGAFKFRGACNAVFMLPDDEASRGVATHSSGNHAAALALAARKRGIPAHIVMPSNAPAVKVAAVKGYGGRITFCEPTLRAREETLDRVIEQTRAAFVHPYNDWNIIAGQATAALELLDDAGPLDIVMTPVGGGGLLSGSALAVHYLSPRTRVIAGEPSGADDACRSLEAGRIIPSVNPMTIADGLLTSLGEKTFAVISQHVSSILTVDDDAIIEAMRLIWERMNIIIEPSAAVPLAAIFSNTSAFGGKRIGIILSGGNLDLEQLPWQSSGPERLDGEDSR